jgi:hypothetical protein
MSNTLRAICNLWIAQAKLCREKKEREFGHTAAELWKFLGRPFEELYVTEEDAESEPFKDGKKPVRFARLNKSFEFLALMMPHVFASVPHRVVTPRVLDLPEELVALTHQAPETAQALQAEQWGALLLQVLMNYLPTETGLARESRRCLPEAFVKGRGVLWHENEETNSGWVPGSFMESVDGLLIDADAKSLRRANYIIREREDPAWWLAQTYGVSARELRASGKSAYNAAVDASYENSRKGEGETEGPPQGDVVKYIEVYSLMGLGFRLPDSPKPEILQGEQDPEALVNLAHASQAAGDAVHLVIVPGVDHPINLPPRKMTGTGAIAEMTAALEWPIDFHQDKFDPWPFTELDFYNDGDSAWSVSPLRAALPLQRFIDHVYTYLLTRVRRTSRDLIVYAKEVESAIKNAIHAGFDLQMVPYDGRPGEDLSKMISTVQFPEIRPELLDVLVRAEYAFEQITGMSPLLRGQTKRQIRSASEATILEGHATSRPDDYADCVEAWQTRVARKECLAVRKYVSPHQVARLFRQPPQSPLIDLYEKWVQMPDMAEASAEWAYSVEAGSGRRRNLQKQAADAQAMVQSFAPFASQFAMAGLVEPWNTLVDKVGQGMDVSLAGMKIAPEQAAAIQQAQAESQQASAGASRGA